MLFMFKFQYQNRKKRNHGKKFSESQSGAIRGLKIRTGFRDYKSGQEGLQIGTNLGISNCGKKITKRSRDFKLRQKVF